MRKKMLIEMKICVNRQRHFSTKTSRAVENRLKCTEVNILSVQLKAALCSVLLSWVLPACWSSLEDLDVI